MYFVVLFVFNIFDIVILQIAINGAIADFVTVLSVILVARFLLSLREVGIDDGGSMLELSTIEMRNPTSGLASIVDSLGGPLGRDDLDVEAE
ncbi:hypothetical protein FKP32DRAFT_889586 [Trametes sanguinea]|nr:hypothetical protein FKP32DRAFT_889586 [Trametes sanguinea]